MPRNKRQKGNITESDSSIMSDSTGLVRNELSESIFDKLKALDDKIDSHIRTNIETRTNTQKLLEEIEKLQGQLFDIKIENDNLRKEVTEFKKERGILVEQVEMLNHTVKVLRNEGNKLEQYTRRYNLRFTGVRDSQGEKNSETHKKIEDIIKKKLNVENLDIDIVHRLGRYRSESDRHIIVKFSSHKCANAVLYKRRALKGSGIGIHEDLTRANAQRLRLVNDLDTVEKAWSKNGDIFALTKEGHIIQAFNNGELNQQLARSPTSFVRLNTHDNESSRKSTQPAGSQPKTTNEKASTAKEKLITNTRQITNTHYTLDTFFRPDGVRSTKPADSTNTHVSTVTSASTPHKGVSSTADEIDSPGLTPIQKSLQKIADK